MFDMSEVLSPAVLIGAAALSADNTPASIDLAGYGACTIVLAIGIGGITFDGSNKIEFKLTESDDNSTFTAVADDDVVGSTVATGGIIKSLVAAHAAAAFYRYGYVGTKRYLKLLADFTGTHGAATPIAATAICGLPLTAPLA